MTAAKIIEGWSARTGAACTGRHILAIQDTSEVKFPTTAQRRRGLGPVKKGNAYGVLVHAMVAVDAKDGACLGLVGGDVWTRPGLVSTPRRQRPLAERESARWLDTAAQAKSVLQTAAMVTVVDDREGDIYAKWASLPQANFHLLSRAAQDRSLAGGGMLFAAAATFAVAGRRRIELPGREPGQAKRTAELELRYGEVEVCRPLHERDRGLPETVRLRLVEVRETDPPAGVEPLHWRLLTTHAIADAADGLADCRVVQKALGHRATVPGDENPGVAAGGQPGRLGGAPAEACRRGDQGSLHRHPVGPGARRRSTNCRPPTSSPRPRPRHLRRSSRRLRARPIGRRTRIRPPVSPGQVGSSPGWVAGTATTSRPGRSPSGAAWSSSMPSIAAGCSE